MCKNPEENFTRGCKIINSLFRQKMEPNVKNIMYSLALQFLNRLMKMETYVNIESNVKFDIYELNMRLQSQNWLEMKNIILELQRDKNYTFLRR